MTGVHYDSSYKFILDQLSTKVGAYTHELATELWCDSERVAIPACANRLLSSWGVGLLRCAC